MPTAKGYTGQYADAASSGLDYYGARYYDPLIGQFASADRTADGLNRYGYVAGNPETATDPSGHRICDGGDGCGAMAGETADGCRPHRAAEGISIIRTAGKVAAIRARATAAVTRGVSASAT